MKKLKTRKISEKEAFKGLSPARIAQMKKDVQNIKFASKHNLEHFGGVYSSVPIPIHLLGRKFSKNDERAIAGLVAIVANEIHGRCARTVQYVHKMPKGDLNVEMIIKNSKWAEKRGKEQAAVLKKLWARKDKLKKHEIFRLSLGV